MGLILLTRFERFLILKSVINSIGFKNQLMSYMTCYLSDAIGL